MIEPALAQAVPTELLLKSALEIVGFAILSAGAAAVAAFAYRWYSADGIADGVAILVGVTVVALLLNTQTALQQAIIDNADLLEPTTAVYTLGAFAASAIAADAGRRLGDFLARDVFMVATPRTMTEVSQLVRAAGRVITVDLPAEIDDIDGYDPVDESVKEELAGQTLLFPRRLTVDQLRERLIARLERDFGVGHVDVDLDADGTIDYLAVGSRQAGIGPTLAPGTVAVAFEGDPAADASPGDAVRVWSRDEAGGTARRVASGELRATAGDVATVALDADDARDLEPDREYRLVTLPGSPDAERDLVSLLRAADETVTTVTVGSDDPLAGATVDALPVLVLALEREGDGNGHLPLPSDDVRLASGDVAYVLGRPEALRRVTERTLVLARDEAENGVADPEPDSTGADESDPEPDREPERPQER